SAGCFSKLFFCWAQPLMKKGAKKLLNKESCVYFLPQDLNTKTLSEKFTSDPQNQPNNSQFEYQRLENKATKSRTVLKSLHRNFGRTYYLLGLLKFGSDMLGFAGPILLNYLVKYVESNEPTIHGCYYAGGLFLSSFIGALLSTHFDYQVNKVSLRIKTSLITAVFNKSMLAKPVSLAQFSTGEITNFMSTDVNRIVNFCPSFHQFWSLPIQVVITLVLLYQQVGVRLQAGLVLALLMILFNRYLAKKMGEYNKDMMGHKDDRVKLMTEILLGIRVVKFNAWENLLSDRINSIRAKELKSLKGLKYFDAGCVYLWATTPVLITLLTFSIYSITGHQLTAAKVCCVGWITYILNYLKKIFQNNRAKKKVLRIENGTFSWGFPPPAEDMNGLHQVQGQDQLLRDLDITIKEGELVGVVGTVGAGKSSLLSAISARMERLDGSIHCGCHDDGIAIVMQESWLQHATIRDNILWGSEYDAAFYLQVVQCCALKEDFAVLPSGDSTEVGENGVTLSGGQKARVVILISSVYLQRKKLYLLDDPLAAVDQHVAGHIFHECIDGLLGGTTRILCTHHTNVHFKFFQNYSTLKIIIWIYAFLVSASFYAIQFIQALLQNEIVSPLCIASHSPDIILRRHSTWTNHQPMLKRLVHDRRLPPIHAEHLPCSNHRRPWNDHHHVLRVALGCCPSAATCCVLLLAYRFVLLAENKPIKTEPPITHNVMWYLMVYGIIAASNSIFTLIRAFTFAYGGIRAATRMHVKLLASIMKAPISFFDATPLGRIINRFSSDLYTIDDFLPFMLNIFLAQITAVLGTIIITCYGLPWFAVLLLPLAVCYYYIQYYYRLTSRELKRLSSISLSPIYAHFNESLMGVSTIRPFNRSSSFINHNMELVDRNQRCNYSTLVAQKWLGVRLQMMGVVMVTGVAVTAIVRMVDVRMVDVRMVGLALSYALSVTGGLSGVITSFTETEKHMVAVERQSYYINNVPQVIISMDFCISTRLSSPWPLDGAIEFKEVCLRYRPNLPLALDGVSFQIAGGEKVGIVGRTGGGKSSLFLVLFGLVPTTGGAVIIDGVNIRKISTDQLRGEMAIIPQDPFLFSGSLRANLDPTGAVCADERLWWALESCGLRGVAEQMGGLDSNMGERGQRLSAGQRQLLCLARALLRKVKIVCLDEATANVDLESDRLIQETILTHFKRCTVLTIAHRIDSVMRSDRVIVMDNGHVIEIGEPSQLLNQPMSFFAQLANQS
uniref:ABC-type xenobiotic transporter n=1 Tax=Ciona savignyi TaxID=51511 RepID=H2YA75_CIOSA